MLSINNQELFEQYYQKEYDFNTSTLSLDDVDEIKKMVREKRVDYALAPIGDKVFEWILSQNSNIRFELIDFESDKIDGMLYIPSAGIEKAYIILNSNKPLINQIFTAMHEYYHYEKDFIEMKNGPYICNFSSLENVNEKRASRFAAEFLLPEEALRNEIKKYKIQDPILNMQDPIHKLELIQEWIRGIWQIKLKSPQIPQNLGERMPKEAKDRRRPLIIIP